MKANATAVALCLPRRSARIARITAGTLSMLLCAAIHGQSQTVITTDSSWGRTPAALGPTGRATTVTGNTGIRYAIPGNVHTITEARGKVAGPNLFHSFQQFSVGAGDAAVFTTATNSLRNVISRVSGSSPTQINGLLALQPAAGSAPGFFFINPAGVTFGAGAQVDVPAAFHVSTAKSLRFADGTLFKTGEGSDSTLTIAAPQAFGFLGNRQVTSVNFNNLDSGGKARSRLKVAAAPGSTVSITGGAVQFASVDVSVPEGVLRVGATGNAAVDVPVNGGAAIPLAGSIEAGDAKLSTTGAGTIHLAGGPVVLRNGTAISANAGGVNVTADTLSLSAGARITTEPRGQGNTGSVTINANHLSMLSGSRIISSSSSTQQNARSGNIMIQGRQDDASSAQSLLVSGNNTAISTGTAGAAQGGNIQIAAQQMTVEQLASITAETSGSGKAGNITMSGDSLAVASGGRIEASTTGEGKGGSIAVRTTGDVTVSGVSADGQTRSGLFAKTQSPSTGTGGGGGGGGGEGGASGSGGSGSGGGGGGEGGSGSGGGGSGGGGAGGGGGGGDGTGGGGGTAAKPGDAGNISINSKNLLLNSGAQIDSSTTSGGAGGSVAITTAESITIAGSATRLTSDATRGDGKGGSIALVANNITVRDHASVTAVTGGKGEAGDIAVTALDQLLLQSAGTITTSTSGSGKGGTIVIQAGQVMLDGPGTGIIADTLRPFADLTITIDILHPNDGDLVVQLDTPTGTRTALLSRIGGTGDGFTDTKFNDQATKEIASGSAPFTGTFKPREPLAPLINELVTGDWTLNVRDQATGNVGALQNWTLTIGRQTFQSTGASRTIPDNGTLRSTITVANPILPTVQGTGEATGIGGDVTVNAGSVTVQNGATLSAVTRGSGKGGVVTVNSTGPVALSGSGSGLNARIATDTFGSGPAGNVLIKAQNLLVNLSEVSSNSTGSLSGNAGNIGINLGETLALLNGGLISSSTKSTQGAAGSIEANARQVVVDGRGSAILAGALENSSGRTGSLTVNATSTITLSNGGILSIRNDATPANPSPLTPTLLSVSAPSITLKDARITAESTGNVDASDIQIRFTDRLMLDPSSITTSANQGDGGHIGIDGGNLLLLDNSQITTSVTGLFGNGGDITLQAGALVMETGFIQANTAGAGARGGNVTIDVQTLVPSASTLFVAGTTPAVFQPGAFGLNVIQAAAPTGVSGTIRIATPSLDIAGSLTGLPSDLIVPVALGKDLCRVGAGSSLTPVGRGGLRPTAYGMIRPEGMVLREAGNGDVVTAQQLVRPVSDRVALAGARLRCDY